MKNKYNNKNRYLLFLNQYTTQNKISHYGQYKLKSIKIYALLNQFRTTQQAQNYWEGEITQIMSLQFIAASHTFPKADIFM